MNKVLKGLVAVAASAAMAIAGVAGASTAMAEENTTATTNPTITFPTDTKYQDHTYEVYQIFTGDLPTACSPTSSTARTAPRPRALR